MRYVKAARVLDVDDHRSDLTRHPAIARFRRARTPGILIAACCVLTFELAASSANALDPDKRISQYAHTAWRVQDGALSGTPEAITQTADGYLWIGTDSGLLRFDGVQFVPWTPPEGKSLPSRRVLNLLGGRDGSLWIGTEVGLARWKDGDLVDYAGGLINFIMEGHDGAVWIARARIRDGKGPLCRVNGRALLCYGQADGIPRTSAGSLAEDTLGNIWISGSTGLCRWKPGSSSTYFQDELKRVGGANGVTAVSAGVDGSVWAGAELGAGPGSANLLGRLGRTRSCPECATPERSASLIDSENTLWVGTTGQGIYRVHNGKVDHFRSTDGLSSDLVDSFYQDREGNLWVTTSQGIDRFHDLEVTSFSKSEGLSADFVTSVLAARDGTVWAGNSVALNFLRQGRLPASRAQMGGPGLRVTSLLEDHLGRLWIGVGQGLWVYDGKRIQAVQSDGGPLVIQAMTEDIDQNVWAEVAGRLVRITGLQVREEIPTTKIPFTVGLCADPHGGIWVGLNRWPSGLIP